MKAVGVIPARYASTRFPGKPLALVAGKPLLQWVFEVAQKSQRLDEVIVATDDKRISHLCEKIGASYVMTDPSLPSGSDRVWSAICRKNRGEGIDVVLNIQGDEPLIQPEFLDLLVAAFDNNSDIEMATLGHPIKKPEDWESPHAVKIVCNHQNEAIYFSRLPIPYSKGSQKKRTGLRHIGIYAYRKEFLGRFCTQSPVALEKAEGLEQLRALYLGARIQVIPVEAESWGVDIPDDIKKINTWLSSN